MVQQYPSKYPRGVGHFPSTSSAQARAGGQLKSQAYRPQTTQHWSCNDGTVFQVSQVSKETHKWPAGHTGLCSLLSSSPPGQTLVYYSGLLQRSLRQLHWYHVASNPSSLPFEVLPASWIKACLQFTAEQLLSQSPNYRLSRAQASWTELH